MVSMGTFAMKSARWFTHEVWCNKTHQTGNDPYNHTGWRMLPYDSSGRQWKRELFNRLQAKR